MFMRDLLAYWPSDRATAECIKVEAEASSEAVAMAVHQPMQFERRVVGAENSAREECNEFDLLGAFLDANLSEGRVILPIVGRSGTGKSHIVRWLETQIISQPGAERRVVIRIPKGSSLKAILKRLLDHIDHPKYERFRKELNRAQESLDADQAAGLLCEMLAQALTGMCEEAREGLRQNPADQNLREREALCRPDVLPALLRNQALRDQHFVSKANAGEGIVRRLVEHLTVDRSGDSADDRKYVFNEADLDFKDVDQSQLGRAELLAIQKLENREHIRSLAVKFLNEGLDEAKHGLIRLDPTVSDLFEEVRKELLTEGRELVLLIEDFAVLSGLQKQLLQVMIKEAVRDGKQILCTMRTALAYTTGYEVPDTVRTRAGTEYLIPDEPGTEQEILAKIVRQVGAYLNAARLGQEQLVRAYKETGRQMEQATAWIPRFRAALEPDSRVTLDAFGRSVDEYELFPFNETAILQLAREGCVEAGRIVYNPRYVIKNVLRRVLQIRQSYEMGQFPSDELAGSVRMIGAGVVDHVKRRVNPGDLSRYLRFLAYWGDCPRSTKDLTGTDEHVFLAFGLNRKALVGQSSDSPGEASEKKSQAEGGPTQAAPVNPNPERSDVDPVRAKWDKILGDWRSGEELGQANAAQLRKWVAEALESYVELNWDLYRPPDDAALDTWARFVYVPRAAGNEGRDAGQSMVAVCTEADLNADVEGARIVNAVTSLVVCHGIHGGKWDFDGAEDWLPRYTAFVDELGERARQFVKRRYFRVDWDPLPIVVQGLAIGARVLGISGADRDTHAALIRALLAPSPPMDETPNTEAESDMVNWTEFRQVLRVCREKSERHGKEVPSWRDHLLRLVGARQGRGANVMALDVLRLRPALLKLIEAWSIDSVSVTATGSSEFQGFRAAAQEMRRLSNGVERAKKRLADWNKRLGEWLGANFDKNETVNELSATLNSIKDAGIAQSADVTRCIRILEEFRKAPIKEALGESLKLDADASRGTVLSVLGHGHDSTVRIADNLMIAVESVLSAAESKLKTELRDFGAHPLEASLSQLSAEVAGAISLLERARSYGTA